MMSDGDVKQGLGTVIDNADIGAPTSLKVQLPLPALDVLDVGAHGTGEAGASDSTGRRGPGRPVGATNKRTKEWSEYLLGRYTSPLEGLAVMVSRGIRWLSIELDCTLLEAARIYVVCCKELAPYLHQKQPVSVDFSDHKKVTIIFDGLAMAGEGEGILADADETILIGGHVCETSAEVDAALTLVEHKKEHEPSD